MYGKSESGAHSIMKHLPSLKLNETPVVPLKIKSPRDIEELEKIKDEL